MRRKISFVLILLLAACSSGDADPPNESALPTLMRPAEVTAVVEAPSPTNAGMTGVLEHWVAAESTLRADGQDRWRFTGLAGDQIRIRAIGGTLMLELTLHGADGDPLQSGEAIEATLPTDGIYEVLVEATQGNGRYEIGLSYTDRANPAAGGATPVPEVVGVPTPATRCVEESNFIGRLESDSTVGGTVEGADHYYVYEGTPDTYIQVEMSRVSGMLDPRLRLYAPDCTALATDDDSGDAQNAVLRNIRLPQDGLYIVEVSGGGLDGGYALSLLVSQTVAQLPVTLEAVNTATPAPTYNVPQRLPAIPGNRLENHVPVSATMDPASVDIYPFYATMGEVVTVSVSPALGVNFVPQLEIVDPDGSVIATADGSTAADASGTVLITPIRATLEGVYQIFVTGEGNSSGAYTISYGTGSTVREVARGEAAFDIENTGNIDRRGNRDVWTVELRAGDIINASVAPALASSLDPILELVPLDQPATVLAVDDNSGGDRGALLREVRIQESGVYLLRVKAAQAASLGTYNLLWRYINVAPTFTPAPARSPLVTIQDDVPDGEYQFYPFYGQAGQRIQVQVTGSGDFDPVAALIGPGGETLVNVDDYEGDLNPFFIYELPAEGTYNIRVNGYIEGGGYELTAFVLY